MKPYLFPALLVTLLVLSIYGGLIVPTKYPTTSQVLDNPHQYENQQVVIRGTIKDITYSEGVKLELERNGREFTAFIPSKLDNPQKGDIIDMKGTSHLMEGYIVVEEYLHRKQWQHHWMFYRSLIGALVAGTILLIDRNKLREVLQIA